jgi:hypothetical protein
MNKSLSLAEFSEMAQQFSLEEQESLVDILQKYIRQQRQPVAISSVLEVMPPKIDPIEKIIGMVKSNITDWADQHDYYLGQTLAKKLHSTQDD